MEIGNSPPLTSPIPIVVRFSVSWYFNKNLVTPSDGLFLLITFNGIVYFSLSLYIKATGVPINA